MTHEMATRQGDGKTVKRELVIRLSDLFRATLSESCGNEGFIGIAPDGSEYHVVAPVDRQIARSLKAWERPDNGTPFGGYKRWNYFCCMTYPDRGGDSKIDRQARLEKARENGWLLQKWGKGIGLEIWLKEDMDATAQ